MPWDMGLVSRIGVGTRLFLRADEIRPYPSFYTPAVFMVFGALGDESKLLNLEAEKIQQAMEIAGANFLYRSLKNGKVR